VRAELQGAVSLLVGIVTLRISLSRIFLYFVKPAMRPWLVASGVVLVVFGVISFLRATRSRAEADEDHHHHVPRAAWLLIAPMLTLLAITPAPLGSFAAGRQSSVRGISRTHFDALPGSTNGAVDLTLSEFVDRGLYDQKHSLEGAVVRLKGFVTSGTGSASSFYLNRLVITCCAADAFPVQVTVLGPKAPPTDAWVAVTGVWQSGRRQTEDAQIRARIVTPILPPEDPYESY
jgi:uncharacterized repeat protein (TIGR03943 family)